MKRIFTLQLNLQWPFFIGFLLLTACKPSPKEIFTHAMEGTNTPWSGEDFDNSPDKFTFAIISDLNGGEREGVFEKAVDQINLFQPEFVLSVGDLIDGGTEDTTQLKKEFDDFDRRASKLEAPFFHLGGNHDLTNPAMRDYWTKRYGARYYHFVYKNVLFLMMDSEDYEEDRMLEIYHARAEAIKVMDSDSSEKAKEMEYYKMRERQTGEIGEEQSKFFEKVIMDNPQVQWTFILMHKPVWEREEENDFIRMEEALGERPYTVINGHFHSYSHRVKNNRDYMILGTTGGSQNPNDPNAFDHFTLVTMTEKEPSIVNVKMDGVLDKKGL